MDDASLRHDDEAGDGGRHDGRELQDLDDGGDGLARAYSRAQPPERELSRLAVEVPLVRQRVVRYRVALDAAFPGPRPQ